MRGKGKSSSQQLHIKGITPAYAGKSTRNAPHHKQLQDHPRLCGEKIIARSSQLLFPGSPPPMRGKGHDDMALIGVCGITPAYAGKSKEQWQAFLTE